MPSSPSGKKAAPKKPKRLRCAYRESGRQCIRDGDGNPPLCNVHRVACAEIGRPPERRSAAANLIDNLLSGRKITRDHVNEAIGEFAGYAMGGGIAGGYHPDISNDGRTQHHRSGTMPQGTEWWRILFPNGVPAGGGARVHVDPEAQQLAAARARARVVMGFAASEPITQDKVRARHRELAKRHHPDRGGKVEKMQEVNVAADVLMAELEDA